MNATQRVTRLTVGSLFSGIGGFDLAAQWQGWRTAWVSEIDPFACQVLAHHFPDAPNLGDITTIDFTTVEPVDVLVGGFPCQDISNAGKQAGITGSRSGLWFEYARAIRDLRPRYVVVENVAALTNRGLSAVLGSLAEIGYDAEWGCFGAADVGAPHKRDRLWLLAFRPFQYANECLLCACCGELWCERHGDHYAECVCLGPHSDTVADTDCQFQSGLLDGVGAQGGSAATPTRSIDLVDPCRGSGGSATVADTEQSGREGWVLGRADAERESLMGHSGRRRPECEQPGQKWWAVEPDVGRVAHGIPARVAQLRALGNAIVPQCATVIYDEIVRREASR